MVTVAWILHKKNWRKPVCRQTNLDKEVVKQETHFKIRILKIFFIKQPKQIH